jgi:hypothetical protein
VNFHGNGIQRGAERKGFRLDFIPIFVEGATRQKGVQHENERLPVKRGRMEQMRLIEEKTFLASGTVSDTRIDLRRLQRIIVKPLVLDVDAQNICISSRCSA